MGASPTPQLGLYPSSREPHLHPDVLGLVAHGHPGDAGEVDEGQVGDLGRGDLQADELVADANAVPGYDVLGCRARQGRDRGRNEPAIRTARRPLPRMRGPPGASHSAGGQRGRTEGAGSHGGQQGLSTWERKPARARSRP